MTTRTKPQFQKESEEPFYRQLKEKVKEITCRHARGAAIKTWTKTICYPALFLLSYGGLLQNGQNLYWFYGCYAAMGVLVTLIVFNIVHDAVHHALFSDPVKNHRAALLLDLMGGNSFVWNKRHVLYHHTFTNVPGWDIDIRQTDIVKFNAKQPHRKVYRYQHLYMPLLYLFYSLNWILVRDFKDYFSASSLVKQKTSIRPLEYYKLFAFKLFYFSYILVLPVLFIRQGWQHFVLAFILMHWLTSACTLLVLLPSHLDEHAQFPEPDENLLLQDTWAIHQLKVTNDFATGEPVLNFFMGGLNHHIAHHLFPTVNHNIIPHITRHIEEAARERNLPYRCYSLRQIMVSHFKLLKNNGREHSFFEE